MRRVLLVAALCLYAATLSARPAPAADPAPRQGSSQRSAWWREAKLGLFVHWGPWSQTGLGMIWRIHESPDAALRSEALRRTFDPVDFDPDRWAELAADAHMGYVVFVAKHHDGFSNFASGQSDHGVASADCPCSRLPEPDITRRVVDAFRARGIRIGLYYSHIDWHHPDGRAYSRGHPDFDPSQVEADPERFARFMRFERAQIRELLTAYGPVDVLWFDIGWAGAEGEAAVTAAEPIRTAIGDLVAMIRDSSPRTVLNDRGIRPYGDFATFEQGVPAVAIDEPWETSISLSDPGRRRAGGYWYKGSEARYKDLPEILSIMAEVFAKGGNLLVGVGPRGDGRIPAAERALLRQLGLWLRVNGEAVFGTGPGQGSRPGGGAGPPWMTRRGSRLYVWVLDWREGRRIRLRLGGEPRCARTLLGGRRIPVLEREGTTSLLLAGDAPSEGASIIVLDPAAASGCR